MYHPNALIAAGKSQPTGAPGGTDSMKPTARVLQSFMQRASQAAGLAACLLLALSSPAAADVTLTLSSGTGSQGGSADVTISIANTNNVVVTVGMDITLDAAVIDAANSTCQVAPRLGNKSMMYPTQTATLKLYPRIF